MFSEFKNLLKMTRQL